MDYFQLAENARKRVEAVNTGKVAQMKERSGMADVVSRVVTHPDWKIYVDHLQAIIVELDKRRERLNATLTDTRYKLPEELHRLHFELAVTIAQHRGLTQAIDTAFGIIEQGKRSKEELDALTA